MACRRPRKEALKPTKTKSLTVYDLKLSKMVLGSSLKRATAALPTRGGESPNYGVTPRSERSGGRHF